MSGIVWDDGKSAGGVRWDAPQKEKPTELQALGRGIRQGGTLGFGDEIGGATQVAASKMPRLLQLLNKYAGTDFETKYLDQMNAGDVYRSARDAERRDDDAARDAHGGYMMAGELLGGALVPVPGGAAAKGAGYLAKVGRAAGQGALVGTAAGLGGGRSDLTRGEYGGAALEAGLGGLMGAGGGALAEGVVVPGVKWAAGKVAEVPNALRALAESRMYKAAGPMLKDFRLAGEDGARKIGRELIDSKVGRFGSNTRDIAKRLGPLQEEAGQAVGSSVGELDEALARMAGGDPASTGLSIRGQPRPRVGFSPSQIAKRLENEVASSYGTGDRNLADLVRREAEAIAKNNPEHMTFSQLEALKRSYEGKAKFDSATAKEIPETYQRIYDLLKGHSESGAKVVDPDLAQKFISAKAKYANIAPAANMAEDQALRVSANRFISPSDYITGAAEVAKNGLDYKALLTMGAHKLLRERGSSAAAITADALADALRSGTGKKIGGLVEQLALAAALRAPRSASYMASEELPPELHPTRK